MSMQYISLKVLDSLKLSMLKIVLNKQYKILCKDFNLGTQKIIILNEFHNKHNYFWRDQSSKVSYYILEDDIIEHLSNNDIIQIQSSFSGYNNSYVETKKLTDTEKIKKLVDIKLKLESLDIRKAKNVRIHADTIASAIMDTIIINKVVFDNLGKYSTEKSLIESKPFESATVDIAKIISHLLRDYSGGFSLFSEFIEGSNGSTVKHMARTSLMSLSFLLFYNQCLNSGYISRIRSRFKKEYRALYFRLLPHLDLEKITLERVFKNGMHIIDDFDKIFISIGFLLHDIGKDVNINYFEGSSSYNKEVIHQHVVHGYRMIIKKTSYPLQVSALVGFHHEYYGHETGYGPFRKFYENAVQDFCISDSINDVLSGKVKSYLPVKFLEIIDIYDALTDNERQYKEPLKSEEAIKVMHESYIEKDVRIDPIIFDIFKLYLVDCGELSK